MYSVTFLYLQGTVVLLVNDFHSVRGVNCKMVLLAVSPGPAISLAGQTLPVRCFMNSEESGWPDYLAIESQYGLKV